MNFMFHRFFYDFIIFCVKDKTTQIYLLILGLKRYFCQTEVWAAGLYTSKETKNAPYIRCSAATCSMFMFPGTQVSQYSIEVPNGGWSPVTFGGVMAESCLTAKKFTYRGILYGQNSVALPAHAAKQNG